MVWVLSITERTEEGHGMSSRTGNGMVDWHVRKPLTEILRKKGQ